MWAHGWKIGQSSPRQLDLVLSLVIRRSGRCEATTDNRTDNTEKERKREKRKEKKEKREEKRVETREKRRVVGARRQKDREGAIQPNPGPTCERDVVTGRAGTGSLMILERKDVGAGAGG